MTKTNRRRHRIFGLFLLIGMMVYVVTIMWLLPLWIKTPINNRLQAQNLQIDYQKLWINPFTLNIHITNLQVNDLTENEILNAHQAKINWHLLPLMQQQLEITHIRLEQAQLNLRFNADNQLIKPQLPQSGEAPNAWHLNLGQLEIIDSDVSLHRLQQTHQITDIDVHIDLADINNHEALSIRLKTKPQGELIIDKQAENDAIQWQLSNFQLAGITMWLPDNISATKMDGQLNANGLLTWPEKQQPIIQILDSSINIDSLEWPPIQLGQTNIKVHNLTVDFNKQHIDILQVNSQKGQMAVNIDLFDLMTYPNQPNTSENNWSWQLGDISATDWTVSVANKKPEITAQLQKLSWQSDNDQQLISITGNLQLPFDNKVALSANGLLNPVRLRGRIDADNMDLSQLNPWLAELSTWQIQQAALTVNSDFCFQQGRLSADGEWQIPELMALDNSQQINAQQLQLKSIGIDSNQQILSFNNITGGQIEARQIHVGTPIKPANIISNQPPAPQTDVQWRLVIDQNRSTVCDF